MRPMKSVAQKALEMRIDDTFSEVAIRLGPILRNVARDTGWPEEMASSLRVINEDGELVPKVPPHLDAQAESLEYGDIGEAPKPALHKFLNSEEIDKEQAEVTDDKMQWALDAIGAMFV